MTTRFSGGEEQRTIQVQYAVEQAKTTIAEMEERIDALHSLGKLGDEEHRQFMKSVADMKKAIDKL